MTSFEHSTAKVAVWNLAGNNILHPDVGIDADGTKAGKQAEGLALLDAELVTLVEVSPVNHIEVLKRKLKETYGLEYESTIEKQPNGSIHIGFLHKSGVVVSNARFIDGSNGTYANGRLALAVDVQIGKFRATVIGVHLKSGRGADDQKLRDSQCSVIGKWITDLRAKDGYKTRTILLMGDFNMIPGQDVSNFNHLGGDDVMDFVSCWDLQDRFSHILEKGRANLLDGFAISRKYSTDYVRGSLRLFPMHWTLDMGRERFRDEVSDHLPFVATVRTW